MTPPALLLLVRFGSVTILRVRESVWEAGPWSVVLVVRGPRSIHRRGKAIRLSARRNGELVAVVHSPAELRDLDVPIEQLREVTGGR